MREERFFFFFFSSRKCYHTFKISFTSVSREISFINLTKLEKKKSSYKISDIKVLFNGFFEDIFVTICLLNKTISKVKNNLLCSNLLNYLICYKCLEPLDFHHCVTVFMILFKKWTSIYSNLPNLLNLKVSC